MTTCPDMTTRPDGLDLRSSLRSALGPGDAARVEAAAARQEQTVDALLTRLYTHDAEQRREMVLLADEVGLGKTFVALGVAWSVLTHRSNQKCPNAPVLVVTPASHALFRKWQREAERFLQLAVPASQRFEVLAVETPHDLARSLRSGKRALVIARMPALSGRLHKLDAARMAVLHALLQLDGLGLSMVERLALLADWATHVSRQSLDLRRSTSIWEQTRTTAELGFDNTHVQRAWQRLARVDPSLRDRLLESWKRIRSGRKRRSDFGDDLREVCRTTLGEMFAHPLPLVIVDEIHNWKNHPQSWWRFRHMLGGRIERLLGLSATPFQLGPHELVNILGLRCCLSLCEERKTFLHRATTALDADLQRAEQAGARLRDAWAHVGPQDVKEIERVWPLARESVASPEGIPPRLTRALAAGSAVYRAHRTLETSLRPFLVRHRREVSHRAWWIGRDARPDTAVPSARGSALRWRPGLDVEGDAELIHYLMMRAVQEGKQGRGATSLGADLGGSYDFFRESELRRSLLQPAPEARYYLELVERAIQDGDTGHEHPKVAATAERAFRHWRKGEKTLVFCFHILTTRAVQQAVERRINTWQTDTLTRAFSCKPHELEARLRNFQNRLYDYRQSLFLLLVDHPLAGPEGRVPPALALTPRDLDEIARRLVPHGLPRDGGRFDRRRLLAVTEQVLVSRWQQNKLGQNWLAGIGEAWKLSDTPWQTILAANWMSARRRLVEGVSRDHEAEPLPTDDDSTTDPNHVRDEVRTTWRLLLDGAAAHAVLAPYLETPRGVAPSLLASFHAEAMARLPAPLRAIATRMLRRMIRAPGFLARFLFDDTAGRPDPDGEDEAGWAALIHRRYAQPSAGSESASERFGAYLETLHKAVGLPEQIDAYDDATRNLHVVSRVIGSVRSTDRDRLFTGFNTPLVPEVLIATTVGQEGIDLHRECRHVIHHDLPWNPAMLEQRTGRIDRIGSKAERLQCRHGDGACLDVVVPYIAGTYDEHRFRVVHGRAHLFEVTMGGEYAVDGHRGDDAMEAEDIDDDVPGQDGAAWAALPTVMADDLRLRLEARPPTIARAMRTTSAAAPAESSTIS